jgi:hypothetical protein
MSNIYTSPICTPEETHDVSTAEPNQLMLFGEQSLFVVRIIWNIHILSTEKIQDGTYVYNFASNVKGTGVLTKSYLQQK